MGSVSAFSATSRLAQVIAEKGMDSLKAKLVGRRIVDVVLNGDDSYEIKLAFKLDDGQEVCGGVIAEYVDSGDDDTVDCCVLREECPLSLEEIKAEYERRGWADRI